MKLLLNACFSERNLHFPLTSRFDVEVELICPNELELASPAGLEQFAWFKALNASAWNCSPNLSAIR
jgi:hypothetical protein